MHGWDSLNVPDSHVLQFHLSLVLLAGECQAFVLREAAQLVFQGQALRGKKLLLGTPRCIDYTILCLVHACLELFPCTACVFQTFEHNGWWQRMTCTEVVARVIVAEYVVLTRLRTPDVAARMSLQEKRSKNQHTLNWYRSDFR